jgi:hypothetical protein
LTHELKAAEVTAVLEEQERLLRLFFRITAASSRSSGRNGALSVVLRLILLFLLIGRTRVRSGGHPEPEPGVHRSPLRSFLNGSKAR